MSAGSTPHRSEGRYQITGDATRVTVTFTDESGEAHTCQGQLSDLSARGVRISLNHCLPRGQRVQIKIEVSTHSIAIEKDGHIRWQHPRDARSWWTGCEIDDSFDAQFIEQLAKAKVLNRRRDPRYETDQLINVRTELSTAQHEARLVNYSKGGFCLLFTESIEFPHHRLLLTITPNGEERTISARVKWARQVGESFGVGCAFTDLDGFVHLRDYVEPLAKFRRLPIVRPASVSSLIALAMAVTIVLQASWIMRSRPELATALRNGWSAWIVEPLKQHMAPADDPPPKADPEHAS